MVDNTKTTNHCCGRYLGVPEGILPTFFFPLRNVSLCPDSENISSPTQRGGSSAGDASQAQLNNRVADTTHRVEAR